MSGTDFTSCANIVTQWRARFGNFPKAPDLSGHLGIFGVVEKPDFSLIIPHERNGFHLVRQYRYPVASSFWEFPQGSRSERTLRHFWRRGKTGFFLDHSP